MIKRRSSNSRKSARPGPPTKGPLRDFWVPKTLEELAAEQGVQPIERLEEVLGCGADLWRDENEWEAFLSALLESRQKGA